jgi:hypothetical protein
MARAPSSAGKAREGSNLSICPVALAKSQACAASSARYMSTRVAPRTPRPTALCTSRTSWSCRPMLVPPVPQRNVADRARRRAPREGTRLRAGVPARGRGRPPGGPLRRGGRSVRPRRTWDAVSGGRARQQLFLTRSPQRSRKNPTTCFGGQDRPCGSSRCDWLGTPVAGSRAPHHSVSEGRMTP